MSSVLRYPSYAYQGELKPDEYTLFDAFFDKGEHFKRQFHDCIDKGDDMGRDVADKAFDQHLRFFLKMKPKGLDDTGVTYWSKHCNKMNSEVSQYWRFWNEARNLVLRDDLAKAFKHYLPHFPLVSDSKKSVMNGVMNGVTNGVTNGVLLFCVRPQGDNFFACVTTAGSAKEAHSKVLHYLYQRDCIQGTDGIDGPLSPQPYTMDPNYVEKWVNASVVQYKSSAVIHQVRVDESQFETSDIPATQDTKQDTKHNAMITKTADFSVSNATKQEVNPTIMKCVNNDTKHELLKNVDCPKYDCCAGCDKRYMKELAEKEPTSSFNTTRSQKRRVHRKKKQSTLSSFPKLTTFEENR